MAPVDSTATLAHTLVWLSSPETWLSVVVPGVLSVLALFAHKPGLRALLVLLAGTVLAVQTAELRYLDGALELHADAWTAGLLLFLAGARIWIMPAAQAFALTWLSGIVVDFWVMSGEHEYANSLRLPIGIGGAGAGDALFVEPVVVWAGMHLLAWVRRRHEARKTSFP